MNITERVIGRPSDRPAMTPGQMENILGWINMIPTNRLKRAALKMADWRFRGNPEDATLLAAGRLHDSFFLTLLASSRQQQIPEKGELMDRS